MGKTKSFQHFELAPGISAEQCRLWLEITPPERTEIANMIKRRFEARFIEPVMQAGRVRGGFAAVALCCLATEALHAFRHGREESDTVAALTYFTKHNPEFVSLRGFEKKFCDNIRNGLLHQAETRGGWRVHISGPVFNKEEKIIGAQMLMEAVRAALHRYCEEVQNSTDVSHVWTRLLIKIGLLLATCDDEQGTQRVH